MSSKNIKITEGSLARAFGPVSRLRVANQDSGTEDFVIEADTTLITKSVDKNGTYHAAAEGAYGYSRVTVNCSQEADVIAGKKQDGNTYAVTKDGDGNITQTKVPVKIVITTMPNVLTYTSGQYIDFTGMVVTCYDDNGESMGTVPFGELVFPTRIAYYDPDVYDVNYMTSGSLDTSPVNQPIPGAAGFMVESSGFEGGYANSPYVERTNFWFTSGNGLFILMRTSISTFYLITATRDSDAVAHTTKVRNYTNYHGTGPMTSVIWDYDYTPGFIAFIDDKTAYYTDMSGGIFEPNANISCPMCNNGDAIIGASTYKLAWVAMWGELFDGGNMEIPVQWARPIDGEVLETSFLIEVSERSGT